MGTAEQSLPMKISATKMVKISLCLPANDFVREEHPLHLRISDVVAALVLDHLKEEETKLGYHNRGTQ